MYGHTTPLLVLPFDHRGSFAKGLFGTDTPSPEIVETIKEMKMIIYEAIFVAQQELQLPKEHLAVLVDEIYGDAILADATAKGIPTMQTTEKSGLDEFDFEYGQDFGEHLLRYPATFAKALVRFNPAGDQEANTRSLEKLKALSDFCHQNNIKLLIEPLIPATPEQLAAVENDKRRFDTELRAALTVAMVTAMQDAGIECDVWKIEGFEDPESYKQALAAMQNTPERKDVGLIILGRNETPERVAAWLTAGKDIPGVRGFAVGRTVFWEPLVQYRDKKITRDETIQEIAKGFSHFAKIFLH